MTITVTADCASFEVQDALIDDWQSNQETKTLKFLWTKNCGGTENEYTVTVDDLSGDGPYTLTVDADTIESGTSAIDDGVYQLKLQLVVDETGSTTTAVGCSFVDCETNCAVWDYQAEYPTSAIWMWYDALTNSVLCSQCKCTDLCNIYTLIQDQLQKTVSDGCGCI